MKAIVDWLKKILASVRTWKVQRQHVILAALAALSSLLGAIVGGQPGAKKVFAFAGGSPGPTFNPNWNIPFWVIDNQNVSGCASDGNDCTHSNCLGSGQGPCLTTAQVTESRWGCLGTPKACAHLKQVTVFQYLSRDDESIYISVAVEPGAALVLQANSPSPSHTGSVTSVNTRTRTSDASGRLVITDSGASAGNYPAGAFLKVASGGGNMWIHSQPTATTVQPTQPLTATVTPTSVVSPAETTVTNGATTTVINSFVNINLVSVEAILAGGGDASTTQQSQVFIQHLELEDPNGIAADGLRWGSGVIAYESKIDRVIELSDTSSNIDSGCINCWIAGGIIGNRSSGALFRLVGGTLASTATQCNPSGGGFVLDGDFWLDTSCTFQDGVNVGLAQLGETNVTLGIGGGSHLMLIGGGYGQDELYGPGNPSVIDQGRLGYDPQDGGDAAQNQMNWGGQALLNGLDSGCCRAGTAIFCNKLVSPPSFDGVCTDASTACGGNCASDFGASATISRNIP